MGEKHFQNECYSQMASFVREILSAAGTLGEKEDFAAKTTKIQKKLNDLKSQLSVHITNRYGNFSTTLSNTTNLTTQMERLAGEVEALDATINKHFRYRPFRNSLPFSAYQCFGSTSFFGVDPDPKKIQLLSVKDVILKTNFFLVNLWANYSCVLNKTVISFKKKIIFLVMVGGWPDYIQVQIDTYMTTRVNTLICGHRAILPFFAIFILYTYTYIGTIFELIRPLSSWEWRKKSLEFFCLNLKKKYP